MGQLQENPGVTALLVEWRSGNQQALERLTPLVYEELKRLAERMFRRESAGHTLQPTALVNEAFEVLVNMDVSWQDRTHFFALSARLMRRILVNHANARHALKRGGHDARVTLTDESAPPVGGPDADILALDAALKAAAVRIVSFTPPPSETNYMAALLTGDQPACRQATQAFRDCVLDVAANPVQY